MITCNLHEEDISHLTTEQIRERCGACSEGTFSECKHRELEESKIESMKIFVFTYDRFNSITTSEYLKHIPHYVLCHTEEQKEKFIQGGKVFGELISTGKPRGLGHNRNFALDMMADGEWAIFMVDDLSRMTYLKGYNEFEKNSKCGVTMENQAEYRKLFQEPCNPSTFISLCQRTIEECERKKFALGGFSLTGNPVFRDSHFSYWCLADGRCWVVKKTHLRFDPIVQTIDDYGWTAQNLKTFGGIVVNNWMLPEMERYTTGGYGTKEERMPQKIADCKYLVENFPDYIAYADKVGWETGSHVRVRQKKVPAGQNNLF